MKDDPVDPRQLNIDLGDVSDSAGKGIAWTFIILGLLVLLCMTVLWRYT